MGSKILLLLSVLVVITKNHAAACSLNAIGVNFGSYDVFSPIALDGIGTIDVNCDTDTAFTLILSSGNGSYFQRYMQYGTNHLNYNLYRNSGMTSIWGDGTGGTTYLSANAKNYTAYVYGRINIRQNVPVGTYMDNIVATLYF